MVYLNKKYLRQHLLCIQIQNEVTHFAGIHRAYVPKQTINRLYFFNNRHIVSFIESRFGKSTVIQNKAKKEAMKKSSNSQQIK